MLQVIFKNFLSFDFSIFVLGLINTFILVQTIRSSKKLYDALNPYCWIPGGEASLSEVQSKFAARDRADSESDIIRLRRHMNAYYVIYENLTAIFPLLGLLGTVVSLLPLVNDMGEVATGSFFSALTSTMWGIIFAIIFKVANGYVAAGIEDNEKNIDIYLQRNTDKIQKMREEAEGKQAETEKTETVKVAEVKKTEEVQPEVVEKTEEIENTDKVKPEEVEKTDEPKAKEVTTDEPETTEGDDSIETEKKVIEETADEKA